MKDNIKCKDCNDTYYITGPDIPNRIRSVLRCSCSGSTRNLFLGFLEQNKLYIQTAIKNKDTTMKEIIKVLNNEEK